MLIYFLSTIFLFTFSSLFSTHNQPIIHSKNDLFVNHDNDKKLILTMILQTACPWEKQHGHNRLACGICLNEKNGLVTETHHCKIKNPHNTNITQLTLSVSKKPDVNIVSAISYSFKEHAILMKKLCPHKKELIQKIFMYKIASFRDLLRKKYKRILEKQQDIPLVRECILKHKSIINLYATNYPYKENKDYSHTLEHQPFRFDETVISSYGTIEYKSKYNIAILNELFNMLLCACGPAKEQTSFFNMHTHIFFLNDLIEFLEKI